MVVADSATAQRRWSAVLNVCYAVNCDVGCWMLDVVDDGSYQSE
jgi:hypothetical protein